MKARKRNSNDEWQEVQYVQLRDSYVITQADQMEFQHDTLPTELKTYDQIGLQYSWQNVRNRAAIAAMQGILSNPNSKITRDSLEIIPYNAILIADELVEQLKKK